MENFRKNELIKEKLEFITNYVCNALGIEDENLNLHIKKTKDASSWTVKIKFPENSQNYINFDFPDDEDILSATISIQDIYTSLCKIH